jgi:uncharacterized protein YndB with AHSA1/START domain
MAVSDSKEVIIEASRDEVLKVIADVESSPEWSSAQQSAEIVDTTDDGRPHRVKMKVKSAGVTDELLLEYTWADDVVSWSLVRSKVLRRQDAKYTLTPEGDKTRVKFELTIDPVVPIPGFLLKRSLKGGLEDGTDALRKRVLSAKKDR